MVGESGVRRSVIDEIPPLDIERNQMEGESRVTGSITD